MSCELEKWREKKIGFIFFLNVKQSLGDEDQVVGWAFLMVNGVVYVDFGARSEMLLELRLTPLLIAFMDIIEK